MQERKQDLLWLAERLACDSSISYYHHAPQAKTPAPPSNTQQLAEVLDSVAKGIENITSSNPELKESVQQMINSFFASPTIAEIQGDAPPPTPLAPAPTSLLEDVKSIKTTLTVLQKVISPSTQAGKPIQTKTPDSAPTAPAPRAKGKNPTPTFANAAASPPRPSIMVSLSHLNWKGGKPSPADLCTRINWALEASDNNQVRISAASVPTGVSPESGARTPDECHAALALDNPSYASLNITCKPSWVQDPHSYSEGAISSLIVAFEDPDGSLACGLLAKKVLYVFGHCATLRKWKQRPTPASPHPELADNTQKPNTSNLSDIDKLILKTAQEPTHTPCSEGPETSKTTKGNDSRQKAGGGKMRDRPTRTPR
ncbi:hypothetical protein EI94DRAFT_1707676 [Lactarius quietus]|nr:hypothetical protein EI94DRAFT_1707676 [Lactarius quietus]